LNLNIGKRSRIAVVQALCAQSASDSGAEAGVEDSACVFEIEVSLNFLLCEPPFLVFLIILYNTAFESLRYVVVSRSSGGVSL
jgi:hypothetical protein